MLSLQRSDLPAPLGRFVDFLWYWEGDPADHAKEAITASSTCGILISLRADELCYYDGDGYRRRNPLKGIAINGPTSGHFAIDAFQPHMMGVAFKPGGAFPFVGPAVHEFRDAHISLEDVWGAEAERLHQRLVQAPTPDDKFDILSDGLLRIAPRTLEHHPAVELALCRFDKRPHRASVAATAREAEVSQKKFIRLFNDAVGMTPKLYLRVARFQRVVERIQYLPDVDWGDVVERHGYYDQSHFIRDFRDFTGLAPTEWLKRRGPYAHHIPLRDDTAAPSP
jgi:AraC-like DNA-binding protein